MTSTEFKNNSQNGSLNIYSIKEKLNDLVISLNKFKQFYELTDEQISEQTYRIPVRNPPNTNYCPTPSTPIIVNHYNDYSTKSYNPSSFYPRYLWPRSETIVINNCTSTHKNKSKNDKDEYKNTKNNDSSKAAASAALIGMAAVAFAGTYIVSKDEYILFYMSKLFSQIKDLNNLVNRTEFEIEFMMLEHQFNCWAEEFRTRTGKKFLGKGAVITSSMVGLSGFYLGTSFMVSGFVGATISGCYLLWNYMTADKDDEQRHFKNLLNKIADLNINLVNPTNASLIDFTEPDKQMQYGTLDIPIEPYNPIYPDLSRY